MKTIEQEVCPRCKGTGKLPRSGAADFPIGSKVHYRCNWWMYPTGTDAEVIAHSKSGQRVRIKYPRHDYQGKPSSGFNISYVTPQMLEAI